MAMRRINRYNFAVVLFVALGSYTYGFNSSIFASVTGLPSFYTYFGLTTSGPRADWSTQMLGGDVNIGMFLFGRGLQGFTSGMIDTICPLYQSEVAPPHARGRMVGQHAFLLVCGYAGASWVGLGTYFEENSAVQWRLCMAFQALAPIVLLIGSPWLPESPRYLIYNGQDVEGLDVLKKLHHTIEDAEDSFARQEFMQIKGQVEIDRHSELSWLGLWRTAATRKRLLFGFFVIAAAQSSGVLVINNYQIILYEGLGITGWKALLLLGVYTSWAAFMNWVNAWLLDRVGRIKLMCFGMTIAAIMMASCYVYLSEIFPTWMRAQGVSFSVAGLFTTTLVYTGSASAAFAAIGWRYYLVFIIVPIACVVVIWFYFPETNGLSLEEIGRLFGDSVAPDLNDMPSEGAQIIGQDARVVTVEEASTKSEKGRQGF
ncbi:hypothetical protein BKA67DRAFT_683474 [Truncatella angustata]|uniref:Major facilitator superfamily (MFS) profile domain-containing protein n=1 Tax=Truncatella angustata TaxID=152316 RepID=A0A9P8ZSQ2_9PEZI|nr:uncharacterized protein BKA67DRAFT_683474 [Truncatella angustata]KAH6648122.1 hypothetical protein BKA67DRAFT_683474 [Truncatella angustata]